MLYCSCPAVFGVAYIAHQHRGVSHRLQWDRIRIRRLQHLAVGVDVVILRPNSNIAGRQNQVGLVHRLVHVVDTQPVRFQLHRVDVNHHLAIRAAIGLRHRRALHAGYLVADVELGVVLQLRLIQPFPFHRDQADRQVGRIEAQHHRRQSSRRQTSQIRHRQVGDVAHIRVRIGSGVKVHLDEADAGHRTRLNVVDAAAQREESLKRIGDVGFHLLRRHAGIKRCYYDHRYLDSRKQVHRHA